MIEDQKPSAVGTGANQKLRQGLTLVPYWTYDPNGQRIACARWVRSAVRGGQCPRAQHTNKRTER